MRKKSSSLWLVILALPLVIAISGPAQAQSSKANVFVIDSGEVVGKARLHRSKEGVNLTIKTSGLVPGDAYSVWWIIFNNPGACAAGGCSGADLGNPDVDGAVMNATGRVANSYRKTTFSAFLPVGFIHTNPASGNVRQPFGPGLQNLRGAEIHVVIRSHGMAIEHDLPTDDVEQISTLFGDCGVDEVNCFDAQAAVFPLPHRKKHDDDD